MYVNENECFYGQRFIIKFLWLLKVTNLQIYNIYQYIIRSTIFFYKMDLNTLSILYWIWKLNIESLNISSSLYKEFIFKLCHPFPSFEEMNNINLFKKISLLY